MQASATRGYKRTSLQTAAMAVGGVFLIVGILGLESIGFAQRLYDQPAQQAVITAQAEAAVKAGEDAKNCKDTSTKGRFNCAKDTVDELSGLKVSVWEIPADQRPAVLRIILGFLVTVAAMISTVWQQRRA